MAIYSVIIFCTLGLVCFGNALPKQGILSWPGPHFQGLPHYDDQRIVGGQIAAKGVAPYQVSLRINGRHFCGASIITDRWLVSAAHCLVSFVNSFEDLTAVVGTNELKNGGDTYQAEGVIVHSMYNPDIIFNDIGMILVKGTIQLSDLVQIIGLPKENTLEGEDMTLTGWGTTSFPGNAPNFLQIITLKSLSFNDCAKKLQNVNRVFETQICSLTKSGQGACHGDSGGPLTCRGVLVGIVSWGMPCAIGYPDVYTRVYSYVDWIENTIKNNS